MRMTAPASRRLVGLLVVLVLAAGGSFCVLQFWLLRPAGEGPAGPPMPGEPFAAPWTDREVVLLGIGDSVTAGFGASPGKSYVARLVDNPPDEFPDMRGKCLRAVLPGLRVENVSVSGSDSLAHAKGQIPSLKPYPKNVFGLVVMTSGGNDLIHWYGRRPPEEGAMYGATLEQAQPWIAAFESRLGGMLRDITALFPGGCRIFLANIYDPSDGGADPRIVGLPRGPDAQPILAASNGVIARCAAARDNVTLVDIHTEFLGHGVRCAQFWRPTYRSDDPHYWYYRNIEDPNDRGYDALRRLFLRAIADTLGKRDWQEASPAAQGT